MPWHIERSGSSYQVVQDSNGHIAGTHPTRAAANRQLAALHASEAEKSGQPVKNNWAGLFFPRRG